MYEGRIEYVAKSLDQLQETITRKEDNMRVVRDIMMVVGNVLKTSPSHSLTFSSRQKLQQQQQQAGGAGGSQTA